MTNRLVLFGATGYTGQLTAHAMVAAGLSPVLAGRSGDRLAILVDALVAASPAGGSPTWQVADVTDPASVQALVQDPSDVIVTTVGPFTTLGDPAISAAIRAGAGYIDSTGEPPFIQRVFTDYHRKAIGTGARLLTAFAYDYVPGNLAGALAITEARAAGKVAARVEIGYFVRGGFSMSSGTKASSASVMFAPSFAFRQGRVQPERAARRTTHFDVGGRPWEAMSVGGTEHYALPRIDAGISDIGVYLGWAGSRTKAVARTGALLAAVSAIPGGRAILKRVTNKATAGPTGQGPDARQREGGVSIVVARAFDEDGALIAQTRVNGPTPYEMTASLLTWAAGRLASDPDMTPGALGPVDAFGLDALVTGCRELGLGQVT